MTDLGRLRASGQRRSTGPGWGLRTTPSPQDVQIVLAVISEYEDENDVLRAYGRYLRAKGRDQEALDVLDRAADVAGTLQEQAPLSVDR